MTAPVEGCAFDAVSEREHGQRFNPDVGWHGWSAPSRALVQDRVRALRGAAAVKRYRTALADGLSDYEAREDGWPS